MAFSSGSRVDSYEIFAPLGADGMVVERNSTTITVVTNWTVDAKK